METAFYAYPSNPASVGWTISNALKLRDTSESPSIVPWPKVSNIGLRLDDTLRDQIHASTCLIADITVANFNVYYEIGFAVGRGKPIFPTLDTTDDHAKKAVIQLGLLDTVGYAEYSNSDELKERLRNLNERPLLSEYAKQIDYQQPLFFLDSLAKNDFRNRIVSAIKSARAFSRSYDPAEAPRLSVTDAIAFVTASSGIILPLLAPHVIDADRHSMRAAFLAGLAHGLERKMIMVQLNELPAPVDYREFIEIVRDPNSVTEMIVNFAREALAEIQQLTPTSQRRHRVKTPQINKLNLGASAAENEFRHLEDYFIQTFQFRRALEGSAKIVVGRKGSGKTAIFFRFETKNAKTGAI
jgi:hypothetical protein